jgi:L-2-hydroxyglutarate oxidase LhgO
MFDYLIIGAGIIGLSVAKKIKETNFNSKILILEKEQDVGFHSSGRNSGVLHAGFYYTSSSLKAKFTRDGNLEMTKFCEINNLDINKTKKVVVAQNEDELKVLEELYQRGIKNNVDVKLIDEDELKRLYPNVKSYKKALLSPSTATINPIQILHFLKNELIKEGVQFRFNEGYNSRLNKNTILTSQQNKITATKIINTAGLYADKIAKDFGFAKNYTIIPFKGLYLKYTKDDYPINTNIYPVPNLKNPFLGVHYTITVDGNIKIGPTAIPAFWRENYKGFSNFNLKEFFEIIKYELKLFFKNSFGFRDLAFEEIKKYYKPYFINLAKNMVFNIDDTFFNEYSKAGIRAQLLDTNSLELLQDFVVEGDKNSIHILNAVSPAFTSSFAFAKWIVDNYILEDNLKT